jgi:hypothetical protein
MADIELAVDEYLWLTEYQQGNVNVSGLVFDDLVEESFDLGHEAYVVWTDQIEETLGIQEAFTPYHFPSVGDTIAFAEIFGGAPIRVKQSVLNVVYTAPLMPIKVAHMHLDVVMSGSDVYLEEVSDELQILSSYANAVPYYWDSIFESFNISMEEPQPYLPIYLRLYLTVSDLVNMRHEVTQEYLFISQCLEEFFFWERIVWGWDHLVVESLVDTDTLQEIIGKLADEYVFFNTELIPGVVIHPCTEEVFFVWDEGTHEKYFVHTIEEGVAFADALYEILGCEVYEELTVQEVSESGVILAHSVADEIHAESDAIPERYYVCLADEIVDMTDGEVSFLSFDELVAERVHSSDVAVPVGSLVALASESLVFADIDSYIQGLIIEEGLALEDVELLRWVFEVLVESGCDIGDIIG